MPIPTPFHTRTAAINENQEWRDWSGYLAAGLYEPSHEREYYAVRNSVALFDVSPLFKYEVSGPDALQLVNRVMTRNIAKCAVGQIMYTPWCNDDGKLIDDGTVWRLGEDHFRITSANPNLRWFQDCGFGLDAQVVDVSTDFAALALQGPHSRNVLNTTVRDADLNGLKYFRFTSGQVDDFSITISRTGFTGDLGYELWVAPEYAERLWDILLDRGQAFAILPAGMVALDLVRIEAGFPLIEVDYIPAPKTKIEAQTSSPYETGMGWAVALNKGQFVGRQALRTEKEHGSTWAFVGLRLHWPDIEQIYKAVDLSPQLAGRASRSSVPLYHNENQVGQATSHTYSPLLKKYIALATVYREFSEPGTQLDIEFTVEFVRHTVRATVEKLPFFDPARKRK